MTVTVKQCSVFIQVWIDTNAVQAGTTKGIYLVDNRISNGSQNAGSAGLQTACTVNSYICWQVFAIDPNFAGSIGIQQIGNSNAWGSSGQPQMVNSTTFTGQVQNPGVAGYQININVQNPGMSGMTLKVNPAVNVRGAASLAPANKAESMNIKEHFVRTVAGSASIPSPQTQIAIVVDTAYIAANAGQEIGNGIYMMDNQLNLGSRNEGQLELSTICNNDNLIGFEVYPMDSNSDDSVAITGFDVSQGNVFGGAGYPIQVKPNYWIGQASNAGNQTYQIQIKVTTGGLRPVDYYVNWDPFITSQ